MSALLTQQKEEEYIRVLSQCKDVSSGSYQEMLGLDPKIAVHCLATTMGENACLRLEELEALDEKRLQAQQQLECYQARLTKAFNRKVRPRSFQIGDLVLAVRRPINLKHRPGDKLTSKWDGPYLVQEVYSSNAYLLMDHEGIQVGPINGKFLKRYYP